MDFTIIIGLIIGITSLAGGYLWEGGGVQGLFSPTAVLIVFGGTFSAVVISFPWSQIKQIPQAVHAAFSRPRGESDDIIQEFVEMATTARREGILALETRAEKHHNPFLREGLLMIVDGTDPELTRQILEFEMNAYEEKQFKYAKIFESAGGYAPTMGIIGTVLGLINLLGNLTDPSSLAHSISVAFTATLYGVVTANLIYLPIANKIKSHAHDQLVYMEMMLEGILALQFGESPILIRKKLTSFTQHSSSAAEPKVGKAS